MARPNRNQRRTAKKREEQRKHVGKPSRQNRFPTVTQIRTTILAEMQSKGYEPLGGITIAAFVNGICETADRQIRARIRNARIQDQFSQHETNWMRGKASLPLPNQPIIMGGKVKKGGQEIAVELKLAASGEIQFTEKKP